MIIDITIHYGLNFSVPPNLPILLDIPTWMSQDLSPVFSLAPLDDGISQPKCQSLKFGSHILSQVSLP